MSNEASSVTEVCPVEAESIADNDKRIVVTSEVATAINPETGTPSKKYLKKMEKRAKYEDVKKLKRKAEKQKLKLKRLQAKEDGSLMPITRKMLLKTVKPIDFAAESARVAIDLSFDDKMTRSEKTKTCKQLLRVYTLNRRAPQPMPVYFCGMKEGTEQMEIFKRNDGYEHWDVGDDLLSLWHHQNSYHLPSSFRLKSPKTPLWRSFPKRNWSTSPRTRRMSWAS